MTVKILTEAQKAAVVTIYTSKDRAKTIIELAAALGVSTRTIGRVLIEGGVSVLNARQEKAAIHCRNQSDGFAVPAQDQLSAVGELT